MLLILDSLDRHPILETSFDDTEVLRKIWKLWPECTKKYGWGEINEPTIITKRKQETTGFEGKGSCKKLRAVIMTAGPSWRGGGAPRNLEFIQFFTAIHLYKYYSAVCPWIPVGWSQLSFLAMVSALSKIQKERQAPERISRICRDFNKIWKKPHFQNDSVATMYTWDKTK